MSIQSYINFLNDRSSKLEPFIKKTILNNKGFILGLVKNRLFNSGRDGNNLLIEPAYSDRTVAKKKELRQRTSFVTLRDKGDFYAGMFVEYINNVVLINSADEKTLFLVGKYGPAILEITQQETDLIIDSVIEPALNRFLNDGGLVINIDIL